MLWLCYQPDGRCVEAQPGETILQVSLRNGIPHAHACGGQARCSTCRVLVLDGLEHCSPRTLPEQGMAERLRFGPRLRLACQTRVLGDVALRRLVLDQDDVAATSQLGAEGLPAAVGEERRLAILFADIRSFTPFAEQLPPFDVVHVLNRFFLQMHRAIHRHGGSVDNYLGDGLLALFGLRQPGALTLCAVRAAFDMLAEMERLNAYLESLYGQRLAIGIGIHLGEVVVGAIGAGARKRVTAIGDAVNVASRVESATKVVGASVLLSTAAFEDVRDRVCPGRSVDLTLAGKRGLHRLHEVLGLRSSAVPDPAAEA